MINVPKIRLQTHRLVGSEFTNPADVVSWMGAVQAQQPNMAKVAVALRTKNGTVAKVEQELDKGEFIYYAQLGILSCQKTFVGCWICRTTICEEFMKGMQSKLVGVLLRRLRANVLMPFPEHFKENVV